MKLLYATFVSHLTYASDVIQYSVSQLQPLGVALNDCIRRIFTYNFYNKCESVRYLRLRLGYLSLTEIFETTTTTTTITITTTTTTECRFSLPQTLPRRNSETVARFERGAVGDGEQQRLGGRRLGSRTRYYSVEDLSCQSKGRKRTWIWTFGLSF